MRAFSSHRFWGLLLLLVARLGLLGRGPRRGRVVLGLAGVRRLGLAVAAGKKARRQPFSCSINIVAAGVRLCVQRGGVRTAMVLSNSLARRGRAASASRRHNS